MRKDRAPFSGVGNQRGVALVSALLMLMTISLMAVGMSTDTSMSVRIAGYQKFKAISFGNAEAALSAGSEVLEDNIYDAGWTLPTDYPNMSALYNGNITIVNSGNNGNFYVEPNFNRDPVLELTGDIEAEVVVQRLLSKLSEGGGVQMAAGYEGAGKGTGGGGVHVIYNLEGQGFGASQAETDLGMHYRHVTD